VIAPGQFLVVFADGQPADATPTELHTNFRLDPTNGVLALSRPQLGQPAVVDYLDYNVPAANQSFGRNPDDFPGGLKFFTTPTPGSGNLSAIANRAPVLAALGAPTAYVGQALSFVRHRDRSRRGPDAHVLPAGSGSRRRHAHGLTGPVQLDAGRAGRRDERAGARHRQRRTAADRRGRPSASRWSPRSPRPSARPSARTAP
jgi:hypothetical protein